LKAIVKLFFLAMILSIPLTVSAQTAAVAEPAAMSAVEAEAEPEARPAVEVVAEPAVSPAVEVVAEPAAMPAVEVVAQPAIRPAVEREDSAGKEIPNSVAAVKSASPRDYILLPSGKRYVLTKEEIAITRGEFNYDDLSGVETEIRSDGTEIKTISTAHIAYMYPDGQSNHMLKTGVSFTAFMRHIEETYYLVEYIDSRGRAHKYTAIDPLGFDVFRASVQFQVLSDGIEEIQSLIATVYNYDGENFKMRYCSKPDMAWGNISNRGTYKPVGESHQVEFDVE
jgi:hypothetical protein